MTIFDHPAVFGEMRLKKSMKNCHKFYKSAGFFVKSHLD
jgi:hypothetical protein